jgi:hypothetical protein
MERIITDIEYLGLPYTHEDPKVMDFRAEVSDIICADLMNQGRIIFAPISSCHHIAKKYKLPRTWDFWKHVDEEFLSACKTLIIVTLEGWEISTGLTEERIIAKRYDIPVEYINPDPYVRELKKRGIEL